MPRLLLSLVLCSFSFGCLQPEEAALGSSDGDGASAEEAANAAHLSTAIDPLPTQVTVDADKAALGERLFSDPRLAGDERVRCSDCHVLGKGGANGEAHSSLAGRSTKVPVNVPSIFNLAFDFRYSWDGRFKSLEDQLDFTMASPAAMAGSFDKAARRLRPDQALSQAFRRAYSEGLTAHTLRDALVAFCRSAITPNSRFDCYLRDGLALTSEEERGYQAFRDYGCVSCHQGVNVGGNMFQRFGVMLPYFSGSRPISKPDLGLYNTSHEEHDRFVFRVPSLRNVALTAPYFHDGSATTLQDAVTLMARYQLGRELPAERGAEIVAFLHTLTGEYRGKPL